MVATFRLVKDGEPSLYEMCWIRAKDGTLEYAVKHFHADLKGWEEKDQHVTFPMVAIEIGAVHFRGLTLRRDGDPSPIASSRQRVHRSSRPRVPRPSAAT